MSFLALDPLYALSESVIKPVLKHVPEFFTDEQMAFERDLARTSWHGFFLRRPIFGPEGDLFAQQTENMPHGLPAPLAGDVNSLRRTPGLKDKQFHEQKELLPRLAGEGED